MITLSQLKEEIKTINKIKFIFYTAACENIFS